MTCTDLLRSYEVPLSYQYRIIYPGGYMVKKILFGIGIVVAIFMLLVVLQPAEYNISREIVINATPEVVFPHVNSAIRSNDWMPWKDNDAKLRMEFTGPMDGVGSSSQWFSDGPMGNGESVIVASVPNTSVTTELLFHKPTPMKQIAQFDLAPTASGTNVKWSVSGKNSFMGRVMTLFKVMDSMVGKEFDKGLMRLKTSLEKTPAAQTPPAAEAAPVAKPAAKPVVKPAPTPAKK